MGLVGLGHVGLLSVSRVDDEDIVSGLPIVKPAADESFHKSDVATVGRETELKV